MPRFGFFLPGIIGRNGGFVSRLKERPLLRLERYPDELFVSVCRVPMYDWRERTVWFAHGGLIVISNGRLTQVQVHRCRRLVNH